MTAFLNDITDTVSLPPDNGRTHRLLPSRTLYIRYSLVNKIIKAQQKCSERKRDTDDAATVSSQPLRGKINALKPSILDGSLCVICNRVRVHAMVTSDNYEQFCFVIAYLTTAKKTNTSYRSQTQYVEAWSSFPQSRIKIQARFIF